MLIRRERWVDIPGFGCMYRISSFGRVWSLHKSQRHGGKPHFLRPLIQPDGHRFIRLTHEKRNTHISLGKLMLLCFKGPPVPPQIWACHNDGDPTNNSISNLRWGTNSENQMDRAKHGTSNHGSRNGMSKLTENDVRSIKRRLAAGETNKDIYTDYPHLDPSMVSMIKTGRHWGHVEI